MTNTQTQQLGRGLRPAGVGGPPVHPGHLPRPQGAGQGGQSDSPRAEQVSGSMPMWIIIETSSNISLDIRLLRAGC